MGVPSHEQTTKRLTKVLDESLRAEYPKTGWTIMHLCVIQYAKKIVDALPPNNFNFNLSLFSLCRPYYFVVYTTIKICKHIHVLSEKFQWECFVAVVYVP